MAELSAIGESKQKHVAVLKGQVLDLERQVAALGERNDELYGENESLSAFGVKQKGDIDDLKDALLAQKRDIRSALAMLLPPADPLWGLRGVGGDAADSEGGEDDRDDGEESSSTLDRIEQEMAQLDGDLLALQKAIP